MFATTGRGEPSVDTKQAERVQAGDTVVYESAQRRVVAVSHDGLWAPYFELDEDGMVSHILVEAAGAAKVRRPA
jgi:hypothetical protein